MKRKYLCSNCGHRHTETDGRRRPAICSKCKNITLLMVSGPSYGALRKKKQMEPNNKRTLIYKEDHQLYEFTPVVFETSSNLTVEEMAKISYLAPQAGRISVTFIQFKELMRAHRGVEVTEIKRLKKNADLTKSELGIVIGATGNY